MVSSIDVCQLSVVGKPGATHGRLRKDRQGTVRSFLVDNTQLYTLVYGHVKKCPDCDPNEILQLYLANRNVPKKGGITSDGLVKLAEKMSRIKGKSVDPSIIHEFTWRCGNINTLIDLRTITPSESVKGVNLIFHHQKWLNGTDNRQPVKWVVNNKFSAVKYVSGFAAARSIVGGRNLQFIERAAKIFDRDGDVSPESPDLKDILTIADVLHA